MLPGAIVINGGARCELLSSYLVVLATVRHRHKWWCCSSWETTGKKYPTPDSPKNPRGAKPLKPQQKHRI